jgi:uncharacterized protein (DUF885 family)
MRGFLRLIGYLFLVALLIGGYAGYRLIWGTPFTLNQLADRQAIYFLLDSPEFLTNIGLIDGTMADFHSGKLSDYGVARRDHDYARIDKFLSELKGFDRSQLSLQEQITYDILTFQYETGLAKKKFDWLSSGGLYPVAPIWGGQIGVVTFLLQSHTIKNKLTAENYVNRMDAIGKRLDEVTFEAKRQAGMGVTLPISLLDKSLSVIVDTTTAAPGDHPLVKNLREKIAKLTDMDKASQDALAARAAAIVKDKIYPAYARMTAAMEAMRPVIAAAKGDGIGRLSDGAEFYALQLKQNTTTDYTAEQIHALGLAEVDRITKEMDAILVSQGLTKGTVGERTKALGEDPKFLYPDTEDGRAQILAGYDAILKDVNKRMPEYFSTVPAAKLEVKRVPPASEKGSAGAYYNAPARDGSREGAFYANLRDVKETPKWSMKTLAYHEGIPGHHFQIALAQGLSDLPFIRQQPLFSAYTEGWALYAERFASEIGMYKDDPFGDLGRLQAEIFRAARLVVDTGLHAKGWTREQAIAYMFGATGMAETDVTTEIERYMSNPGQACAYKVGQLKILELREKAKTALGEKFKIKDFHTVVLESGTVPLTVLERLVDDWIARAKGA